MEEIYQIIYAEEVERKDFPSLDKVWADNIVRAIDEKLTTNPLMYGVSLRGQAKGYYKLRVGDYRVIYSVSKSSKRVTIIILIGHRSRVYKEVLKRI